MADPRPVDPQEIRRLLDDILPGLAVRVSESETDLADVGVYPETDEGRRRTVNRVRRIRRRDT